jgi:hypothetical protein
VKYVGVILDKEITWRIHAGNTATKALQTFRSIHPLLKSGRVSVNKELTLYRALISSIMTYACHRWEFAADSHL